MINHNFSNVHEIVKTLLQDLKDWKGFFIFLNSTRKRQPKMCFSTLQCSGTLIFIDSSDRRPSQSIQWDRLSVGQSTGYIYIYISPSCGQVAINGEFPAPSPVIRWHSNLWTENVYMWSGLPGWEAQHTMGYKMMDNRKNVQSGKKLTADFQQKRSSSLFIQMDRLP